MSVEATAATIQIILTVPLLIKRLRVIQPDDKTSDIAVCKAMICDQMEQLLKKARDPHHKLVSAHALNDLKACQETVEILEEMWTMHR